MKKNHFLILLDRFNRLRFISNTFIAVPRPFFSSFPVNSKNTHFFVLFGTNTIGIIIYVLFHLFLCDLLSDNISLTLTLSSTTLMSNRLEHTFFCPFILLSFLSFLYLTQFFFFFSSSSPSLFLVVYLYPASLALDAYMLFIFK